MGPRRSYLGSPTIVVCLFVKNIAPPCHCQPKQKHCAPKTFPRFCGCLWPLLSKDMDRNIELDDTTVEDPDSQPIDETPRPTTGATIPLTGATDQELSVQPSTRSTRSSPGTHTTPTPTPSKPTKRDQKQKQKQKQPQSLTKLSLKRRSNQPTPIRRSKRRRALVSDSISVSTL